MCGYERRKEMNIEDITDQSLKYIIFETLAECGIYGEEATIKFIGVLKRIGRSDLLPPCMRGEI